MGGPSAELLARIAGRGRLGRLVRAEPTALIEPRARELPRDELGELAWVSPDPQRLHVVDGSRHFTAQPRCSVGVWRGYVKKRFLAADATGEVVAVSPLFPGRSVETASTPQAEQAFDALLDELARNGWVVTGEGPAWYDRELIRTG